MLKAIIFDFDGTIVDTELAEISAWQAVLAEHDLTLPDQVWFEKIGYDAQLFDPVMILEKQTGIKLNRRDINSRVRTKLTELHALLQLQPGVLDWIHAARNSGLKLAIASNSSRKWILKILTHLNLLDYFDVIFTRDDVKALKPDPEIYQLVLTSLNLMPQDAVVIEDSPAGTMAAVAAGLNCIVVPTKQTMNLVYPDTFCRVNNLGEVTLQHIIEKLTLMNS